MAVSSRCSYSMWFWNGLFKDRIENGMTIGWLMQNMNIQLRENWNQFQGGFWEEISTEMVANSMKSCAFAFTIDGSEDRLI